MKLFRITKTFVFTVFGASGDLAKVKIFPALYALAEQKRLPKEYVIFGYARSPGSNEQIRKEFETSVINRKGGPVDKNILDELLDKVHYFSGQYDDKKSFEEFTREILIKTAGEKVCNIAYLAVPPVAFEDIITNLAAMRPQIGDDLRLIIEKPFGYDEMSAETLYHHVSSHFAAEKIFLLDHYLGKEAVQSVLALRYANSILNTILDGKSISNIQITAFEDLSVESRISYFDQVGIIKDMVQSHLLQLLALLTMDLPVDQDSENIHREKYSILSALKYRGYENGICLGQHQSYGRIKGAKKGSKTPTFAAMRLFIDRQEWYRVPIYIRTGKMLHKKHSYIVVEFEKSEFQKKNKDVHTNKLIIELQPNERIHLKLYAKVGGHIGGYHDLTTSESIACYGDDCLSEHGRLLLDVFKDDHSHFLTFQEIIATWKFTDKILRFIEQSKIQVVQYEDYSAGPTEQHKVVQKDGLEWHDVELEKTN